MLFQTWKLLGAAGHLCWHYEAAIHPRYIVMGLFQFRFCQTVAFS